MRKFITPFIAAVAFASTMQPTTAQAATIWTGPAGGNITTEGHWDNGLPISAGNPGTINSGTVTLDAANTVGYFVTQNGGDVSSSAGLRRNLYDGSWTINGGTFVHDEVLGLQNGTGVANGNQSFSLTNGSVTTTLQVLVGSNASRTAQLDVSGGTFTTRNVIVNAGSNLNISGGIFTANNNANASGIRAFVGSSVTISGGTVSSNQEFRSPDKNNFFLGGTSSFSRFNADAGFGITLGGNTSGSVTVGTVNQASNFKADWLTGSLMSLTISSVDDWAETYWDDGRMTYNGQSFNDLGDWSTVSSAGGLGGGASFDWNGTTNTLALIPEPASLALVGLGGLMILGRGRRSFT